MRDLIKRLYYKCNLYIRYGGLNMRDLINRIVERLYYKCYPDRVNDHDIANTPIPVIREERYRPETYTALYTVPRELIDLNAIPPIEYIKKDLVNKLMRGIENEIEIREERDEITGGLAYRAEIRILKNERRGSYENGERY